MSQTKDPTRDDVRTALEHLCKRFQRPVSAAAVAEEAIVSVATARKRLREGARGAQWSVAMTNTESRRRSVLWAPYDMAMNEFADLPRPSLGGKREGAGRKPINDHPKKPTSCRLSDADRAFAESMGKNLTEGLERCIDIARNAVKARRARPDYPNGEAK